ncbi:MAG: SOS response-associated peptidase [Bacteroidales bacterium]|nr:SOS response-associated peptidase [Bacteroidales bacterium]
MCFSISFNVNPKIYVARYINLIKNKNPENLTFEPAYFVSAFDFPELPIVTTENIMMAKWGLVPRWFKGSNINETRLKILNVKIESVVEKIWARHLLMNNRCLLGVTGFFEWRSYNNQKYPYYIKLKNTEIFSIGCFYDEHFINEKKIISFTIITTQANEVMQKIHNVKKRMPLIIKPKYENDWLTCDNDIEKKINEFIILGNDDLEYYTVSKIANYSKKNRNIPEILQPVKYSELPDIK